MPKKQFEYYVKRTGAFDGVLELFEVAKFDSMTGGEQPVAVYTVKMHPHTGIGKCDCQAATYRGTGDKDKHVNLVRRWKQDGERIQAYTDV
jgi:hypothetical protein